ncbi:MAG: glucose-6-phosphate isomerase, partial [Paracoccaceae bacterium]
MFENLKLHARAAQNRSILSLFDSPERAEEFSLRWGNMLFDYSKTNMDGAARDLLLELFVQAQVDRKRSAMFSGQKINETENRAVLHVALRNQGKGAIYVDGADVMPEVRATRASMVRFCKDVRSGDFRGQGGKITDVVNIGIGGSDLGPAMVVLGLAPYHDGPACHFVSNIDGAHISDVLKALNPETTLVIVASKTFTTIETMTNAATALDWMSKSVKNPAAQFAALSSATEKTAEFGISDDRVFGFSDWVGGRYSLWGPIGLSIMIAIGPDHFDAFLEGAYEMDQHFLNTDPLENMPVMLALTGIWHNQVCG